MTHPTDDELEAMAVRLGRGERRMDRKPADNNAAEAALRKQTAAMLRACKGGAVKVKPLVFTERKNSWWATSPFGIYVVAICETDYGKNWAFWTPDQDDCDPDYAEDFFDYEREALAAAQADYERRILSALEPSPDAWQEGWSEAIEAAASKCDVLADIELSAAHEHYAQGYSDGADNCAAAIRALTEKGPTDE